MTRIQFSLTFVALLLFVHAAAQVADFAPVGAKWYYDNPPFVPPPWGVPALVVEVTGEEMVQGQLCRKIEGTMVYGGLSDPLYVLSQNDSVFYFSNVTQHFELLYDFTAGAGDSWMIRGLNLGNNTPDSCMVFVDSIGNRIVGNDTLTVWYIAYEERFDWGNEILEKVGNICFLSPDPELNEAGPCGLRCYEAPQEKYHFVDYPCDTLLPFLSTTQQFDNSFNLTLFPNPASNAVTLQYTGTSTYSPKWLTIRNALGREILNQYEPREITDFEVGNWSSGIYVVQILWENGQIGSEKLMVWR